MGLVVWLPLNGNLENQGVSAVTATNNGAIVNTAGKIGSCYSFDGTDDFLTLNNFNPNGWPEISISAWVYPTAAFDHLFLFRGSGAHRFKINSSGVVFRDTNNSTQRHVALGQTISTNVWTHITCVYKRGEIWIYQNGIQTAHNSTYYNATSTLLNDLNEYRIARVQSSSGNDYYTGKINDFRIYDHALSAAEVHEISQGLVLHYKLDDITNGITDSSGYNRNGTMINTIATEDSTNGYYSKHIHISASNQHIQLPTISYSNFGNSFTIAWWGKRDTNSGKMFWGFSDGNRLNGLYQGYTWNTGDGSNNPIYQIGTTTNITSPTATDWHHYAMTGDGTSAYLYVDGVQYGKAKTYKGLTGTQIWINGWRNHTEYSSASLDMSDFRIYATALSANDIKTLYGARARIDNKKNMHAYEYNELKNVTNAQEYFTTTSADGTYYINQYRTPTTPAPSYKTNYINAYSRTCTSSLIPIEPENTYTLNYTNAEATTYTYTYASKVWKRKNGNQYTQVTTARYYGCAAGYKVELLLYDQSQELIKSKTISHETYGGVRTSNSYTSTSQTFSGGSYVFHLYDAELSSYDNVKYIGIITTVYGSNITSQGVFTISKAYSPSIKMYNTGIVNASLFNENEDIKFKPGASIETNNLIEM